MEPKPATNAEVDSFSAKGRWVDSAFNKQTIYSALRQNLTFCKQFVLTFMDLVNVNFKPERVLAMLEEWGNTDRTLQDFFTNRAKYIVPYMAKEFGLTGTLETVTLYTSAPEGGTVTLNTITPDLSNGEWSGQYYTDYPVTISAKAAPAYKFAYWTVNGEQIFSSTADISLVEGGLAISAVFERQV